MPPRRRVALALVVLAGVAAAPRGASAQGWADKMFEKTDHDFGAVARGSDTVYKFQVKNIYKEDVHLQSVRSSCGCTTPSIEGNLIKTYGTGYVVAKFNTRTFQGLHSATLTVTIDKPFPAQVQLRVHGNIRGDIVFEPGSVDFGAVDQGQAVEKIVSVNYAGRAGWKIEDVRSASSNLEVELTERRRSGGSVGYDLLTRLKETATPGFFTEQLILVTNDVANPRVPLDVQGTVTAAVSVSPANLVFGNVPQGEKASKKMIVRGKKPFKIVSIGCDDPRFSFSTDEEARDRHIVEVTFTAGGETAPVHKSVAIATDLGETFRGACDAYATVVAPPAAEPEAKAEEKPEVATGADAKSGQARVAQGE